MEGLYVQGTGADSGTEFPEKPMVSPAFSFTDGCIRSQAIRRQ